MHELDKARYIARLMRRNPSELLHVLSHFLATCKFRYLKRCVGRGTVVGSNTKMINSANIRIGENCWLQDMIYLRAGNEGSIEIGDRVAINSFCRMFGHGSIRVGDDAQIGPGTLITTTQHDFQGDMQASFRPVVIGKRAWIGANVTILPGVTIGEFSVIGAGSVVTKNVPPSCVAVGVPARVIRTADEVVDQGRFSRPGPGTNDTMS